MGLVDFILMINTTAIEAAIPPGTSAWDNDEAWDNNEEWINE
jgi:hypothetical protein